MHFCDQYLVFVVLIFCVKISTMWLGVYILTKGRACSERSSTIVFLFVVIFLSRVNASGKFKFQINRSNVAQGSHSDWKTWESGKAFSSQRKIREFEQTGKVRENHSKYWKTLGISDKSYLLFFNDI